ncbi:MAG: patatin-like phospholipase family protein [Bacteroidota bacterium]
MLSTLVTMMRLAVLLACLVGLAPVGKGQTITDLDRPTVGLVLSGGSAKGIAHIGAIRELEAAGLPVDVVTGTSMGSIVGALYALGYSADEMETIVTSRDWPALFSDAVDRRDQEIVRRIREVGTLVSLPVEGTSVSLPSGLVAGQDILALFSELMWPARGVRDFRTLPRPFAAVVVDAETGEGVRVETGSLARAVRASMSLPSLFEPVDLNGRRVIDGGYVRNLPAEDALALGADVLVCVDVSASDTTAADRPPTFLDVMVDATFYNANRVLAEQRALCDVIVDPDVNGLSAFAFEQGTAWIERGAAATRSQRPALDSLVTALGNPGLSPPPSPTIAPARISSVEIRGVEGGAARLAQQRLDRELDGQSVTPQDLSRLMEVLYATGAFDLVTYRLDSVGDGTERLVIDARPSSGDRLGIGFRYDTVEDAALLFTLTLRDCLFFGSTADLSFRLGQQTQIQGRYLARLGLDSPWTVAAQAGYVNLPFQFFAGNDRAIAAGNIQSISGRVYAGPTLFNTFITGVGPSVTWTRGTPEVGADSLESNAIRYAALEAFAFADTRDKVAFSTRGWQVLLSADWGPGIGNRFQRLGGQVEGAVPVASGVTARVSAVLVHGWEEVPFNRFATVGGPVTPQSLPPSFFPLYGAELAELIGPVGQTAALGLQAEVRPNLFATITADVGRAGLELSSDPEDFRFGYGLSLGAATPLGPAEVLLSGEAFSGRPIVTFQFGHRF